MDIVMTFLSPATINLDNMKVKDGILDKRWFRL